MIINNCILQLISHNIDIRKKKNTKKKCHFLLMINNNVKFTSELHVVEIVRIHAIDGFVVVQLRSNNLNFKFNFIIFQI